MTSPTNEQALRDIWEEVGNLDSRLNSRNARVRKIVADALGLDIPKRHIWNKECVQCGKPWKSPSRRRRLCSPECRAARFPGVKR